MRSMEAAMNLTAIAGVIDMEIVTDQARSACIQSWYYGSGEARSRSPQRSLSIATKQATAVIHALVKSGNARCAVNILFLLPGAKVFEPCVVPQGGIPVSASFLRLFSRRLIYANFFVKLAQFST